jgi:TetR/AcrR family transcriptional regulator
MTRVIIGDALVNEDERLQLRMNQFIDRIELAIKQSLRVAATQGQAAENEVATRASMIVSLVLGRWHRFAKTGFRQSPSKDAQEQIAMLLA